VVEAIMNPIKLAVGCLVACASTVACSVDAPSVDVPTAPAGNGSLMAPGTGTGTGGVGVGVASACKLDTRQVVESQGRFYELVTSRGRLFAFENGAPVALANAAGAWPTPYATTAYPGQQYPAAYPTPAVAGAVDLTQIPLYAAGPCQARGPNACVFETHAFVLLPGNRLLEYVTGGGRQWVFESGQMTGAGVDLSAIPRYAEICANRGLSGGFCKLDTRTFLKLGNDVIESITAYGKRYQLNIDGLKVADSGIDLTQVPAYANGPCRGRAQGQCVFETRTFEYLSGQVIETVTAYGAAFRFTAAGAEIQGNGAALASVPHWANGPCR